jgi:plasmid stabilization system protein ParE
VKLVFTKKAQQDLDNIALHIATHDVETALRLVTEIERRARILLTAPSAGRLTPRKGIRELVVDNYVLPYRASPRRVVIMRVWHGKQRWWG